MPATRPAALGSLIAAIALASIIAACGHDGDEAAKGFCDDLEQAQQRINQLDTTDNADMEPLVDELEAIDPPGDIADAYDDVIGAYTAMAETGSLTDPDTATDLADADQAIDEIDHYITEHCGPGTGDAS